MTRKSLPVLTITLSALLSHLTGCANMSLLTLPGTAEAPAKTPAEAPGKQHAVVETRPTDAVPDPAQRVPKVRPLPTANPVVQTNHQADVEAAPAEPMPVPKAPMAPMTEADSSSQPEDEGEGGVIQSPSDIKVPPRRDPETDPMERPVVPSTDIQVQPTGGLTLDSLQQMAITHNPSLRQSLAQVREAQGNWTQVGLYANPTVGYTASEIGQEGQAGQQGAYISQTIITAHKLKLNRDAACWDVERARWQSEAQRLRIMNDVRIRYFAALGAQITAEIAGELKAIAAAGVKTSKDKFDAQEVALSDVLQAEIQLNQVEILLDNAHAQQLAARQQLANVIGVPALPNQPLIGSLEHEPIQLSQESLWQEVSTVNPVLEAARAEIQRAQRQLARERVQPIPNLQTQFSLQYDAATDYTVGGAQVGVALPIFDRNQGGIFEASATVRKAIANHDRLQFVLRDRLAEAFRRYEFARNQVVRYRDEILPKAQRNLDLTARGYQAGEFDFIRLLTARQTLFETRVRYVNSLTQLQQTLVELDGMLLTGGLSDPANNPSPTDPTAVMDAL